MIVSVFVRRLKPGHTFEDFLAEWEADVGFGVPTRVFNGPSLDDPRTVISIGFVDATTTQVSNWLSGGSTTEGVRHERIESVVESTQLRAMYEVRTEHDFTAAPSRPRIGGAVTSCRRPDGCSAGGPTGRAPTVGHGSSGRVSRIGGLLSRRTLAVRTGVLVRAESGLDASVSLA
jgi:hypothetical protein